MSKPLLLTVLAILFLNCQKETLTSDAKLVELTASLDELEDTIRNTNAHSKDFTLSGFIDDLNSLKAQLNKLDKTKLSDTVNLNEALNRIAILTSLTKDIVYLDTNITKLENIVFNIFNEVNAEKLAEEIASISVIQSPEQTTSLLSLQKVYNLPNDGERIQSLRRRIDAVEIAAKAELEELIDKYKALFELSNEYAKIWNQVISPTPNFELELNRHKEIIADCKEQLEWLRNPKNVSTWATKRVTQLIERYQKLLDDFESKL